MCIRDRCEDRLYDQHFYVTGAVQKLQGDLIDTLTPDVATFTARHLRWATMEAAEHDTPRDAVGRIRGRLATDNAIEQRRWLRDWYARLPLFVRPSAYFLYRYVVRPVSYTHLRAHETPEHLVCRLLLEK